MKKIAVSVFFLFLMIYQNCKKDPPGVEGKKLADQYCGNCHLRPEPNLLDKKQWQEYVLPRMGQFMGILPEDDGKGIFYEKEFTEEILSAGWVMRKYPELNKGQFEKIVQYYVCNAPDELDYEKPDTLAGLSQLFNIRFPPFYFSPPSSLLVKIVEEGIICSDVHTNSIFKSNLEWNILDQTKSGSEGAVCFNRMKEGDLFTLIGSFSPTDKPLGRIIFYPEGKLRQGVVLIDSLRRPVHCTTADLNGDSLTDLIVSEFGKWAGVLSIHTNDGKGSFQRKVLLNKTGCVKTQAGDFNQDGLTDIMALFAQGDESMYIFYNLGQMRFEEKLIMRFPSSYGSSGFRLFDWNQDGRMDILHLSGDLADFPIPFKPYHGIRIFVQKEKDKFEEEEFIHFPGAYDALPHDFDLDGDLDLAAISFFIDPKSNYSNGFMFFENNNNSWIRKSFTGSNKGRWITMDSGDLDRDGDLDLVLGNLVMEFPENEELFKGWVRDGIPYVVLLNQAK